MPASADRTPILVDTSVAIALVTADHEQHEETSAALRGRVLGLAGHAAFETFSVLTRLPAPLRRTPATVARLIASAFPETRYLGSQAAAELFAELTTLELAGGAVYDALVGAAANEHQLPLATRDRRALDTYRALNVSIELLA